MTDVIYFWLSVTGQLWTLIVSNWMFSISVLLLLINLVITIVNNSSRSQ